MKSKFIQLMNIAARGLLVGSLLLMSAVVRADNEGYIDNFPGGVRVVLVKFGGKNTGEQVIQDQPGRLQQMMNKTWNDKRPAYKTKIEEKTKQQLPAIRDPFCSLAQAGELRAKLAGDVLYLKYVTRGNYVSFYVTTPGPLSRDLDPKFTATFDAELVIKIPIPSAPRTLKADEAKVYVRNSRLDSGNITGDLVKDVNALIKFVGGTGIFQPAERAMNERTEDVIQDVNPTLAAETARLQTAANAGYTQMSAAIDQRTGSLVLRLARDDYDVPTSGPGVLSGTIRWEKAQGHPRLNFVRAVPGSGGNFCDAVNITVTAQSAPSSNGVLITREKRAGRLAAQPTYQENGNYHECLYTINNLPTELPLRVEVSANRNYQWVTERGQPAYWQAIGGQPVGWSNPVTLRNGRAASGNRFGSVNAVGAAFGSGLRFSSAAVATGADFALHFTQPPR